MIVNISAVTMLCNIETKLRLSRIFDFLCGNCTFIDFQIRIMEKEREIRGIDDPVVYLFNLTQKSQEPTDTNEREVPSNDSNILSLPQFNICFISQDKLERNVKRRYESHMISKVTQILQSLVPRNPYLIIAVYSKFI